MNADQVADAILGELQVTPSSMVLQKLLYYTQAWHLAITNEPLFAEECRAWANGPVVEEVWRTRKSAVSRRPRAHADHALTPTAFTIMRLVVEQYGRLSGDELSELTHAEQPWRSARRGVADNARSNRPISHNEMARFYRDHRVLNHQTAAELAAGGLNASEDTNTSMNYDALLAGDTYVDQLPDLVLGSANLSMVPATTYSAVRTQPWGATDC